MNIRELIDELQKIQREHGDIHVSGGYAYGHPELTIHGISYEPAGPLASASPENNQRLPERVFIEWKIAS
jgi:hypothetical protein